MQNRPLRKVLATDSSATSFAAKVSTLTEPTGGGVLDLGRPGETVPHALLLFPYGTGGENDTLDVRVIGWRRMIAGASNVQQWLPTILGQFTCTLSAQLGVAGGLVVATERFADTIITHATITGAQPKTTDTDSGGAASTGGIWIVSPANDLIASIKMPTLGCEKLEVLFDSTAAGTTAMNALYALLC